MTFKSGVVELLEGVLHVLVAHVLHHPSAVLEHVAVAHVPRLPHVVLEVLPAAGGWETRHSDPVLAPPGRGSSAPSSPSASV